jgi:hypothetical protein
LTSAGESSANSSIERDSSREWIDRPWEIRYVLFVSGSSLMSTGIKVAREANAAPEKVGRKKDYLNAEELFEPTATFDVPGNDPLAVVAISFDKSGQVTSQGKRLRPFSARISVLGALVLTSGGSTVKRVYRLAEWSQGIPGDETFSPAVCTIMDSHRYEDGWESDYSIGSFGCREWTAQLYSHAEPYIDVTSYGRQGNFVGEFVGWSRFSDPRKPIIGMHGKTWLCLHDCPVGETPGVIPDIVQWAARHRFPVPTPPPRQPMYPNSNYKDDLSE